jgi:triphosphatase
MLTAGKLALDVIQRNAVAFATHAAAVRTSAGDTTHDVHQARVATRRLRAALRLFKDVLPEEAAGLRDELKWIANQFAPVRDLDVQLMRLGSNTEDLRLSDSLEPYAAWLRAERDRAMLPLCQALQCDRFASFSTRLASTSDWQPTDADFDQRARIASAVTSLRDTVDDAHAPPSPTELHRIRIRAKRARYTVEFFEDEYGASATKLRERLVAVQDLLGGFQDTVVSRQRIAESGQTWPPATLLALGQLQLHEQLTAEKARRKFDNRYTDAEKAWKRFASTLSKSKLAMS